ncbi:uncharacterized protein LOC128241871 [Mya arenaria]|uniref:uncharacterized protein LOC128241871 n=1 Tax=Mya arenaria TaxID=6604 RepID=UPI0022E60EC2|nr:uncharacterized protein LOC128241871 [Mya arenaria]
MAQVGQWSHSLFGCFDDFGTCIIAYLVPCVAFGQTAEAIGEGSCFTCGLAYLVPVLNLLMWIKIRGRIREQKGIEGDTIKDCLTILCCPLCALVQEAQEVKGSPQAQSMCRE